MDFIEALILGIVQGVTEFLPISSSAHLVLVPWWLGWEDPSLVYEVTVHIATTLAVIWYFWHDWLNLIKAGLNILRKRAITEPNEWLLFFIMIGTIPAVFAGLLLESAFEKALSDPEWVAIQLYITAALLLVSERIAHTEKTLAEMTWIDSMIIGVAQAVSVIPGISRSGSTIASALWRGFNRADAARYSFLLATPIILGAGLKKLLDVATGEEAIPDDMVLPLIAGFIASLISGYLCIAFLLSFVRRQKLNGFAYYCIVFATITLIAVLVRG